MKKALSYMLIGAAVYGAASMWVQNKNVITKHMKKLKKSGMDAYNKVKAVF